MLLVGALVVGGGAPGLAVPLGVAAGASVVVAKVVGVVSFAQLPRLASLFVVLPPLMHRPWLVLQPQSGALQSLLHKNAQHGSPTVVVPTVLVATSQPVGTSGEESVPPPHAQQASWAVLFSKLKSRELRAHACSV